MLLNCSSLSKAYGSRRILKELSFTLDKGETAAIMGRSGCGKTTLLKCIALLEKDFDGSLELDGSMYCLNGKPLIQPWEVRRHISMVFQDFNLFPHMTVLQNITLSLRRTQGNSKGVAEETAGHVLDALGIDYTASQYPETLSGGEAQRVALARAIVLKPLVLLLDEITSNLDSESALSVLQAIRRIRAVDKRKDFGILIVTHNLPFAESFSDRILFLREGRIIENWPAREFVHSVSDKEAGVFIRQASQHWTSGDDE